MADIILNDGDFVIYNGDIALCDDISDIIQHAVNACKTRVGEIPFHPDYGNSALGARMKYTSKYTDTIEEHCTNAILMDEEIADVLELTAELNNEYKPSCTISFRVMTIDDREITSTFGIELR